MPFNPATRVYFETQTASNCGVSALNHMLGYCAVDSVHMRDFGGLPPLRKRASTSMRPQPHA
jgi:hypothetical protein